MGKNRTALEPNEVAFTAGENGKGGNGKTDIIHLSKLIHLPDKQAGVMLICGKYLELELGNQRIPLS